MIITDVQPRRHRLSQLYIDGEAAVKVDTETWLRSGLMPGVEIDDERLHRLLQDSAAHRAHEKALYLLEHRAHSKKELERKIARAEFDVDAAKAAADRMEELGLIDDEQYARRLTQELFTRKKFGVRRVKQELREKGIADEIIALVLEEFSPEEEETVEKIRELIERKYPMAQEDEKVRRRAVAALQRYGYSMDDIFTVLREEPFD
ncbi:MAG: regulatory protein RecX [Clostridia bacterium]|nr:regulatory protein RecX [Clostridia bacterium]